MLYHFQVIYSGRPIESRIWSIERRHFQWPWTASIPTFKVTPFFDAEYLENGTIYRHSVIEILIGTYTPPTQQCHCEWPWVTLSDLQNIQWHEASSGLSATTELLVSHVDISAWSCCIVVLHFFANIFIQYADISILRISVLWPLSAILDLLGSRGTTPEGPFMMRRPISSKFVMIVLVVFK